MLLLGAGASKPFGIKTMEEMSREFENIADEILRGDEKELCLDIKNTLSSNNLEDILTVLNDLTKESPNPSVRYLKTNLEKTTVGLELLGHLKGRKEIPIELIKELSSDFSPALKDSNISMELQLEITKFIKKNCALQKEEEILQDIIRVYDQLFEILKCNSTSIFDIFTTNYDLIIEKYVKNKGTKLHDSIGRGLIQKKIKVTNIYYYDGFRDGTWNQGKYNLNDPHEYDPNIIKYAIAVGIPIIRFFKLHGSIDYYFERDKIVKRDILYSTPTTSGEERLESMIYPMREKEVYKDPFFELFARLKTSLLSENICIVIGYSSRDEHIRNIFFDAVKRNPEIRIFMMNPNAKKIRDDLEPIKDNIEPIEGKFGEEKVFEELKQKT